MSDSERHRTGKFAAKGQAVFADSALAAKQAAIANREVSSSSQGGTVILDPIFVQYIEHLVRTGRDPKTISRNQCSLERLGR